VRLFGHSAGARPQGTCCTSSGLALDLPTMRAASDLDRERGSPTSPGFVPTHAIRDDEDG